jgi:hypothetical protein
MVNQSDLQRVFVRSQISEGRVQAAPADAEIAVIVVVLAKEGAIYGEDREPVTIEVDGYYRAASGVTRCNSGRAEVTVVPVEIRAELEIKVWLGTI